MASITINKQDGRCCHNNPTDPREGCYLIIDGMLFRIRTFDEITQEYKYYFLCKQNGEYYENYNINDILDEKIINESLWLLTTPLLNECYYFNSSKYAPHYCLKENDNPLTYKYPSIQDLMTVDPFKFLEITETGQFNTTQEGSLYYYKDNNKYKYIGSDGEVKQLGDNDPFFKYKYNYDGNLVFTKVANDLYPDCIDLNFVGDHVRVSSNSSKITTSGTTYNYIYSDEVFGRNLNDDILIKKLFLRFEYILNKIITSNDEDMNKDGSSKLNCNNQFQIGISSEGRTGDPDFHSFIIRQTKKDIKNEEDNKYDHSYWDLIEDTCSQDSPKKYSLGSYKNEIFSRIYENYIFMYGFGDPYYHTSDDANYKMYMYDKIFKSNRKDKMWDDDTYKYRTQNFSRIWWKTNKGDQYALIDKLICRNTKDPSSYNSCLDTYDSYKRDKSAIVPIMRYYKEHHNNETYEFRIKNFLKTYFGNLVYNAKDNINDIEDVYTMIIENVPEKHNDQFQLNLEYIGNSNSYIYPEKVFIVKSPHESIYNTIVFGSSSDFYETIEQFDPNVIDCLYVDYNDQDKINFVLKSDTNLNKLVYNIAYYKDSEPNNKYKLYPISDFTTNSQYKLDFEGNYNAPLYCGNNTKLIDSPIYDNIETNTPRDHQDTAISYQEQVYVVPSNIKELKNSYTGDTTVVIDTRPGSNGGWTGGGSSGGGSGGGSGRDIDDRDRPVDPRGRNEEIKEEWLNLDI